MSATYHEWLARKVHTAASTGFDCGGLPDYGLFDWQAATVRWACGLGRCALFADTGLGKTAMQLAWADRVRWHLSPAGDAHMLVLTPLAVGPQTVREAVKFHVPDVRFVREDADVRPGISVCNYESMHKIDLSRFGGVVLDESSILKNFMGQRRTALIEAFATTPYRMACTATPAPNDHVELGNHSEFLGGVGRTQMMARWFINDLSNTIDQWRLKGHAVRPFWGWVTSWARCIGVPSDMGTQYSDAGFVLPELVEHKHSISVDISPDKDGMLFRSPELSATSIHKEKRRTAKDRARAIAEIVTAEPDEPWVVWVETDYDAAEIMALLPDAYEVSGKMPDTVKEERLLRFSDSGGIIVTKPGIAGMGLNWQHCARMAFMGLSFSYERYYQAVRRSWRFGQHRPVHVHVAMAATEAATWLVINRKANDHERMKIEMFAASRRAAAQRYDSDPYIPTHSAPVPAWFRSAS